MGFKSLGIKYGFTFLSLGMWFEEKLEWNTGIWTNFRLEKWFVTLTLTCDQACFLSEERESIAAQESLVGEFLTADSRVAMLSRSSEKRTPDHRLPPTPLSGPFRYSTTVMSRSMFSSPNYCCFDPTCRACTSVAVKTIWCVRPQPTWRFQSSKFRFPLGSACLKTKHSLLRNIPCNHGNMK